MYPWPWYLPCIQKPLDFKFECLAKQLNRLASSRTDSDFDQLRFWPHPAAPSLYCSGNNIAPAPPWPWPAPHCLFCPGLSWVSRTLNLVSLISVSCPALLHDHYPPPPIAIPFLALPGSTMLCADTGCGSASVEITNFCLILVMLLTCKPPYFVS